MRCCLRLTAARHLFLCKRHNSSCCYCCFEPWKRKTRRVTEKTLFWPMSRRWQSTDSSFDIFKKLKDPPETDAETEKKRRKPSDKVLKLVDEIMSLTLIEAADLCDLCQEKLGERSSGRTPFPHPVGMFAGMVSGGAPGLMQGIASPFAGMQACPPTASVEAVAAEVAVKEKSADNIGTAAATTEEKEFVNLKLLSYDKPKKVTVVKEVRAMTALGLKESKELVEECPKIVKKGISKAEAAELKKKLEAAGAEVAIE